MPRLQSLSHPSVVLFACLFTSQAGMLVLSPILLDIAREFGVSTAAAGQLRSVSGAVGGLTALALVVMPRRPGLRDLLSLGAGLITAGSVLSAAAPSFAVLAAAQGVLGLGLGLLVAVGIAAAGEWSTAEERPQVLSWAIAGMPAAWIAGMPLVGAVSHSGWRATWLAVPAAAGLITLALLRLRPGDAPSSRAPGAVASWRRPEVARFASGELLANAAWASVLTYSGALLLESYSISAATAALALGLMATAMLPGTFKARRGAANPSPELLAALTALQAASVLALGAVRPGLGVTLLLLAVMAFVNGWRSMVASALGMDASPEDRVAVMAMRAAANQFGYLLGAAAGGAAIALGGFPAMGAVLAIMFIAAALVHFPALVRPASPVPQES